jgi:DNA (cytosine-5)-methyltransferase 1
MLTSKKILICREHQGKLSSSCYWPSPAKTESGPRVKVPSIQFEIARDPFSPDLFGAALRRWSNKSIISPIRTLSLFSGAGGLDIGFRDAGFSIEAMVEVDSRFIKTLSANTGRGKYLEGGRPVRTNIRDYYPPKGTKVDFIIGGPPCQPFSAAARRAAGVRGTADERGILFKEYVRLVRALSPQGFLFENVSGLVWAENGAAWKKIRAAFARAGYKVFFHILDAADYGAPQHRKRLFIVGTKKKNYRFPIPLFGPHSPDKLPYLTAAEAIKGVSLTWAERRVMVNGKYGHLLQSIPPGLNYSFYTDKMGHPQPIFAWRSKFFDFLYKADPHAPIRTLMAQGGHYTGPFHWRNRRFSIAEMKRLQTIPDKYEIVGGWQVAREQIGNAVPPQMARVLALTILSQVFGVEVPFELPLSDENRSLLSGTSVNARHASYQRKAQAAITRLKRKHEVKRVRGRQYVAYLSEDFGWTFPSKEQSAIRVQFLPSENDWTFRLSHRPNKADEKFSITVKPAPGKSWGLKVPRVVLSSSELSPKMFTGAWKAFEMELARREIKDDLVQLCGYYTYEPTFQGEVSFAMGTGIKQEWMVVRAVVQGKGVGEILSAGSLGKLWGVPKSCVLHHAVFLRGLGYEVRNQNTNPQIPKNHFLIPYVFPTLNPLSVQRRKSLEKMYGNKR